MPRVWCPEAQSGKCGPAAAWAVRGRVHANHTRPARVGQPFEPCLGAPSLSPPPRLFLCPALGSTPWLRLRSGAGAIGILAVQAEQPRCRSPPVRCCLQRARPGSGGSGWDGGGGRARSPPLAGRQRPAAQKPGLQPSTGQRRPRAPGFGAGAGAGGRQTPGSRGLAGPQLPEGDAHQAHLLPSLLGLHLGAGRLPVRRDWGVWGHSREGCALKLRAFWKSCLSPEQTASRLCGAAYSCLGGVREECPWGSWSPTEMQELARPLPFWAHLRTPIPIVCNFMSHEKCLKHVKTPCTSVAPSLVRVPVAHCFGSRGVYKRKFCAVCRKGLEAPALRCEVCELYLHPDCVPFACSDCRQCHQDGHQDHDVHHHHHWREGNLSSGARCEVCRKMCSSSEVLAGLRCEWCGVQAHSVCSTVLAPECTFGRLRSLVLPPTCVRLLSRNFSKMHCFRITEMMAPELGDGDGGADGGAAAVPGRETLVPPESSKQTLKIFDGDDAVRRNQFRVITISRLAPSKEVLEAALRAYYIPEDPDSLELHPLPSQAGNALAWAKAGILEEEEGVRGPGSCEAAPEAWVIRALPQAQEVLKIYPGWLKVGMAYVSLCVTPQSTARKVVLEALPLLGRQAEGPESFHLVEVLMGSRQVQRTVLADEELLLNRLWDIRQEYSDLLHEAMATKAAVVSVSHVYSAQGAVVLDVACFAEAERLYMLVRDTAVQGRALTALVLPDVLHSELPSDSCPLLVFVNPKSGGLKGRDLLCSFRKLLNPHQVFELTSVGPLPGFHLFSQVPCFRVLVCGGDGTVGWVLAALEETRHHLACPEPSVAILPLGTGNDLGRVLRWGAGYSGEDPFSVLVSVDEADTVLMDRWTILLDAHQDGNAENGVTDAEPPKPPAAGASTILFVNAAAEIVQMSNYCGIGIDAELSLDFHQARNEEPGKFTSRFHNKGVYVRVGLQKISQARGLHREIRLQVGQQEVPLPSIEGLIFINIPSWGSGADLWGSDSDTRFEKPRMDDGLLEVVGVTGVVHMGQVQGGLRSGIRIAQGSYFRVTLLKAIPVQVDGEPWVQAPGNMIISAAGPKVHMLRKAKQKPRKAGTSREVQVDATSAPEGDLK
ncbi:diacylglycerol kinase theta isoform X4 [Nycticebus coucang]|uniref:diacylglycerol kinase theta isoform X4 n=1 Tax=Nycticebus coucang TaxID=9470 RepID=UPI00234D0B25|nr:diacylglycerol kinase theta isoform X4 [Nycticebus coucang]